MERNLLLAIVLSVLVIITFQAFFPPEVEIDPKEDASASTEERKREEQASSTVPEGRAAGEGSAEGPQGPLPAAALPETSDVPLVDDLILSNERLKVVFTQKGAAIKSAELLDYRPVADSEEPLMLLMPSDHGLHALRIDGRGPLPADLGRRAWRVDEASGSRSVSFSTVALLPGEPTTRVELRKVFTLPEGGARHLKLDFTWRVLEGSLVDPEFSVLVSGGVFQDVNAEVTEAPPAVGNPVEGELLVVRVREVRSAEQEVLEEGDFEPDLFGLEGTLAGARRRDSGALLLNLGSEDRFVGDCSNYFGAFLMLAEFPATTSALVHTIGGQGWTDGPAALRESWEQGSSLDKLGRTASVLVVKDKSEGAGRWEGLYYLGPIDARVQELALKDEISPEKLSAFRRVSDEQLGFFGWLSKAVLSVLRFFHGIVGNWGGAVIMLTVLVRLCLSPLNIKAQVSMNRMQTAHAKLKPKIDKLKEKYADDPQKMAQKQMELFRKEKVPMVPIGGCLPIFLQMPIFFALFGALRASLDLRQANFLWVSDLSQPDHLVRFEESYANPLALCGGCCETMPMGEITGLHLLPILMTIAWFANSMLMPRPEVTNPQVEQQRKLMMFMPLLFGFFMYGYAAALSLYWLTSSLIGILESRLIRRFVLKKGKPEASTTEVVTA